MLGLPMKPTLPVLLDRYPAGAASRLSAPPSSASALARRLRSPTLEKLFLDFLDRHGFPRPLTNLSVATDIGMLIVDCAWPAGGPRAPGPDHPLIAPLGA